MAKKLTKKQKAILHNVLSKPWAFTALWDNLNQTGAEFKEVYDHTEKEAKEALAALVEKLET